jgi:hypothetical protein
MLISNSLTTIITTTIIAFAININIAIAVAIANFIIVAFTIIGSFRRGDDPHKHYFRSILP